MDELFETVRQNTVMHLAAESHVIMPLHEDVWALGLGRHELSCSSIQ
jgi:hypothetical protein